MLTTELCDYLKDFNNESNKIRSLLIDGPWGCGKTYNVFKYLETYKPNYVYVSLFGLNSLNEVIIRLSEKIDSSYIVNINGHYFINGASEKCNSIKRAKYNNGIVIIDDIERKNDGLSFKEVCGLVSSLVINGFKVICILNDKEVDDENYYGYVEKTFEKELKVYGDSNIIAKIINDADISNDSIFKASKGNYRLIEKSNNIYDEISKKKDSLTNSYLDLKSASDRFALIREIVIALRCFYSTNNTKIEFSNDTDAFNLRKIRYEENVKDFGVHVANELDHVFADEKENMVLYDDVLKIMNYLKTGTYDELIVEKTNDILSIEPFCNEYYYLDDKEKLNFKQQLFNMIDKFDFSRKGHLDLVLNFLRYCIHPIKKKELSILADQMIKTESKDKEAPLILYLKDYKMTCEGDDAKSRISQLIQIVEDTKLTADNSNFKQSIDEASSNRNYSILTDLLYKHRNEEDAEKVADEFEKKNYCLPDLSKRLDYSIWTYCHEIARFVSPFEKHRKKFISLLIKQCKNNKSLTLRSRCNALTKYNFNVNFDEIFDSNKKD